VSPESNFGNETAKSLLDAKLVFWRLPESGCLTLKVISRLDK